MNKTLLTIIVVIAFVFIGGCSSYSSLVAKQEKATTSWADVQSTYQRRADLIPSLVETVKGYAKHESQTLEAVVNARAKATSITVDPDNLTPEKLEQFQKAQGELSQALGKLLAVQENYPDLKANENFKDLQVQLEGTENRINEARLKFNKAVQEYNISVRRFPTAMFAGVLGFEKMDKFEADAESQKAPKVSFD